jgi:hemerythrin
MALRWTSALSIGVAELDAQHQELFRRVDRLLDAMLARDRSEATGLLAFLQRHVTVHLVAEEQLMREVAYPDAALHSAEHRAFAAEIDALASLSALEGPTARLVLRLEREVTSWLQNHVYSTDRSLARFVLALRAERANGGPAQALASVPARYARPPAR